MSIHESSSSPMVVIGRILKPFGVHGEVRVESLTDVPGRFERLHAVLLTLPDGRQCDTHVISVRQVHQGVILGFSAFSTPEAAKSFRGAYIQIPESRDLPREKDLYYQFELIGLQVEDPEGHVIGKIEEVQEYPQHHVLVIRNPDGEILVPASRQTIDAVDLSRKTLRLTSREWWDVTNAL